MRLPILDKFYDEVQHYHGSLTGWGCIYVQHLLQSNIACAEFLLKMGLHRDVLRIIGKAYSTSYFALGEYRKLGFNVVNVGDGYQYVEPFDDALINQAKRELVFLQEKGIRHLLIIDEGAIASRAVGQFTSLFDRIAVVELTSRGAPYFPLIAPFAPVVDVARSPAKKTVEAPIIAASMVDRLKCLLSNAGYQTTNCNIGLIGAGAIGSAIIDILEKDGVNVNWFDRQRKGGVRSISELVEYSEILLSSTGEGADWASAISSNANRTRIFANCGSSDIEFNIWKLRRELAEKSDFAFSVEAPENPWTGRVILSFGPVDMIFFCGGFPINFDGSPDPIPPSRIQLTRAILMAGAIQAINLPGAGVYVPDLAWQNLILRWFGDAAQSSSTIDGGTCPA